MKFAKSLILVTAIVVALVAPALQQTAKADDKIELSITWWGSQTRHDKTIAVIELYEQQIPILILSTNSLGGVTTLPC